MSFSPAFSQLKVKTSIIECLVVEDEIKSRSQTRHFRGKTKKHAKLRQDTNDINEVSEDENTENETDTLTTRETSTPSSSSTTKRIGSKSNSSGMDGWKNFSMRAIVPGNRGGYLTSSIMDVNGLKAFLDTIDMNSLARLFVNLDFLDSMSDDDSFTVGMDGTILLNASPYTGSYGDGPTASDADKLQFPTNIDHKTLEILIGEFTPNSMLQQAHRYNFFIIGLLIKFNLELEFFVFISKTIHLYSVKCSKHHAPPVITLYLLIYLRIINV